MEIKSRNCVACSKEYLPTGNSQKRCKDCIANGIRSGPTPKCICGCGSSVSWSIRRNGWSEFVQGHHARVDNPNKGGNIPWNKGNQQRYDFICAGCKCSFQSKLKEAKFCSHQCYTKSISGSKSIHWRGGVRTTYRMIRINGNQIREHRYIMAQHLNRKLKRRETVHHIDGNGLNNSLDNLHLFHCEKCHRYHHTTGKDLVYIYGEAH